MNITNGSVTFTRKVKPADYEGKDASCTLSFVLDEEDGPDVCARRAMLAAQTIVLSAVGLPIPAAIDAVVVEPPAARTRRVRREEPAVQDFVAVEARPEAPTDPFLAGSAPAEASDATTPTATERLKLDDKHMTEPDWAPAPGSIAERTTPTATERPKLDDKHMTDAIVARIREVAPKGDLEIKVRMLINEVCEVAGGGSVFRMTQDQRYAFLDRLGILEP